MRGRRRLWPGAQRTIGLAAIVSSAAAAYMALVASPPDAEQGDLVRLLYVHVPTAWVAYLAFGVVFVASIGFLRTGRTAWDRLAAASAEVGVVFTSLTIVLGSIWAKPVWGTWWSWDPRLTTTAILLLIYLGYLTVRRSADSPGRRARWSAVVGIVGFVDVPIVHLSVRWWRSLHQPPARLIGVPNLAPSMGVALMTSMIAFTLIYLYLVLLRMRVARAEERAMREAFAAALYRPADELISRG